MRCPTAAGPLHGERAGEWRAGGGRVAAGDVVLEVPQVLLISYDTAKSSDLVRAAVGQLRSPGRVVGQVSCVAPSHAPDDNKPCREFAQAFRHHILTRLNTNL